MKIITNYYGYFKEGDKNVYGLYCGFLPANIVVEEETCILYPEVGNILINKITKQTYDYVDLLDWDCSDNYEEIANYE